MIVTFLGLAGTGGILPGHYTQILIDGSGRKTWPSRLPRPVQPSTDRALLPGVGEVSFLCRLRVGSASAQEDRTASPKCCTASSEWERRVCANGKRVADEVLLYYAGHLSHRPRSAVALQQIVTDFFHVPAQIQQFRGQWLHLRRRSNPADVRSRRESNNQLGVSAIAGARVWGIENKFRVRLGPLSYESSEVYASAVQA